MFQIDFEGRATGFVARSSVELGRKNGIKDNPTGLGLSHWRTQVSVTKPEAVGRACLVGGRSGALCK